MDSRVRVLGAAADALFPRCMEAAASSRAAGNVLEAQFYEVKGSEVEGAVLQVIASIETKLTPDSRRQLHMLLRLLDTRAGTLLLLGRAALNPLFPSAFPDLPCAKREQALLQWVQTPRMQKAFKGLKGLITSAIFTALGPDGSSPLLAAMGYDIVDPERPLLPAPPAAAAEAAVASALVDLSGADGTAGGVATAAAALAAKGLRVRLPAQADKAVAATVMKERPHLVVQCDAVVVGSGAGGGVAAARLAAAGLRVVVLEKSSFVATKDMTGTEGQAFSTMYELGGLLATENGATSVLAGSTLGGGTRVNWSASFPTPAHVRREWSQKLGLTAFEGPEYDAALEAVGSRLAVQSAGHSHGASCCTLAAGLTAAGVSCDEVPRNCADPSCSGHCCFGCARGSKQDSVNTFLADACRSSARVVTGAWAQTIITERIPSRERAQQGSSHPRSKRTLGVLVTAGRADAPLRVAFAAPVVVCSAGALHTPALLLRSGVSAGGLVGSNLRLHPCTCVVGVIPPGVVPPSFDFGGAQGVTSAGVDSDTVSCWRGPIMSVFSREVGDWEGSGYGALLYTPSTHAGLFAAAAPWVGGRDYKDLLLQFPNVCVVLVLCRDQGSGHVAVDAAGRPRLHYSIAPEDRLSMVRGMQLGLKAMAAAGAHTVMTLLNAPEGRLVLDPGAAAVSADAAAQRCASPAFEEYLAKVGAAGVPELTMPTFSAHQMGTCRLGVDPSTSVVDPDGQSWEVQGLHCCDGSVMPTPSGVNPMVTIEAVSWLLAGGIAQQAAARKAGAAAAAGGKRGVLVAYEADKIVGEAKL